MKRLLSIILMMCVLTGCQDNTAFVMEKSNADIVISGTILDNKEDSIIIKDTALKNSIIDKVNNNYQKKDIKDELFDSEKLKVVQGEVEIEIYPSGYLMSDSILYQSKSEIDEYKEMKQIVSDLQLGIEVYIAQVDESNYIIQTVVGYNMNTVTDAFEDIQINYPDNYKFSSSDVDVKVINEFKKYGALKEKYGRKTIEFESIKDISNIEELKDNIKKSTLKIDCLKQNKIILQKNVFLDEHVTIIELDEK